MRKRSETKQKLKLSEIAKKKMEEIFLKQKKDLLVLKEKLGTELESLEKFSTFLKDADNTMKTSHNKYKVDKIVKMAFSTYVVDHKNVVAYQLKSPLEGYKNLDSFLNGVDDGT